MCVARVNEFSLLNEALDNTSEDDQLADFFRRIGGRVVLLKSGLWTSRGCRLFEPVLLRAPVELSAHDRSSLWAGGSMFLRYTVSSDQIGRPSYIHLVEDKNYDLDSLLGNKRRETRRSLKFCHVERIPISYVIKHGLDLVSDTYLRQKRYIDERVLACWKKYFEASAENPLFEAWGAFVGEQLGAFRVNFTYRGGFYGEAIFNRQDLLKYQVMSALMFVSTREVIRRQEIDHVSYGIRPMFNDMPALDRFKESIGYKKIEVLEKIECATWLRFFCSDVTCKLGCKVLEKYCDKSDKAKRIYSVFRDITHQRKIEGLCGMKKSRK